MMLPAAGGSAASAGGGRSTTSRGGLSVRAWVAGGLVLAWLPACARAQEEAEGDAAAVEEGGGESNDENSSVAKAVERWLPLFLGLLLALAVLGWCAVNVLRASRARAAEELAEESANKLGGNTQIRQGTSRMPSYAITGERGGGGTGDVSPEGDATLQLKRSLRGPSIGGQHAGALRGVGGDALLPQMIFKGDELQGKKAPGEQGDVYQNPMQRSGLGNGHVSTPGTSDATSTSHSSGSISSRYLSSSRAGGRSKSSKSNLSATGGGKGSGKSGRGGGGRAPSRGGGDGGGGGNGEVGDSSDGFDMMELGASMGRRGSGGGGGGGGDDGGGHRRRPTTNFAAKQQEQSQQAVRRGSGRGSSSSGGNANASGRRGSASSTGSRGDRHGRTNSVEEMYPNVEDGDEEQQQQSNLSRSLRPAMLRAARPILRNSSSGVLAGGGASSERSLAERYERNTAAAAGEAPSASGGGGGGRRR